MKHYEDGNKLSFVVKLICIIVAVISWRLSQKLLQKRKQTSAGEIFDFSHVITKRWNDYLNQASRAAQGLLILSSLIIDGIGIFLILETLLGNSVRPFLELLVVFSLRQINQFVTALPSPKGMIWRDPGFPSLFVTYGVSNDLFFSGHSALITLGALELLQLGSPFWAAFAAILFIFEVSIVLILRAHWALDVFTGVVVALCTHLALLHSCGDLDLWFKNL